MVELLITFRARQGKITSQHSEAAALETGHDFVCVLLYKYMTLWRCHVEVIVVVATTKYSRREVAAMHAVRSSDKPPPKAFNN